MPFDRPRPAQAGAQRARGAAALTVRRRGAGSAIGDLRQSGALKLMFPRPRDGALDAVFLNTAGGITGGDRLTLEAGVAPGAALRLTSQAAERIYRAAPGPAGRVDTRLRVAEGARLDWLPQETILFDGAALDRRLAIDLAADARFVGVETLIFGRAAMGETVRSLRYRDRIDLRRDGRLIWSDRLRLCGDAAADLGRGAVAGGARAMATLVLAARDAAARLPEIRALLPDSAGASALDPGLVILRCLAPDGFALRATLIPLLRALCAGPLPRPWMI